jgi:hypothetical protein
MASAAHPPIEALGSLGQALCALGYTATVDQYAAENFGDFVVRFRKQGRDLVISRDRGQFTLAGDRAKLEPAGLWRAFDSAAELQEPLLAWLARSG